MQQKYLISDETNQRLIIFFSGWSTNWRILKDIKYPRGYDVICIWDYRELDPENIDNRYEETLIIGWSFGVAIVEKLYIDLKKKFNITGMYAINGSRRPVDNIKGIPEEIFLSTLKSLNEKTLKKFQIRISGGKSGYSKHLENFSTDNDISALQQELMLFSPESFRIEADEERAKETLWDLALVGEEDKIFPLTNLLKSWEDTPVKVLKENHYPDFQKIFNLIVKNKNFIGRNFERKSQSYDESAEVQKELASRLIDILKKGNQRYNDILELGSGTGILTKLLLSEFNPKRFTMMDLIQKSPISKGEFIKGDIEIEIKKLKIQDYDLIISGSTFQWLHSPTRLLKELKKKLKPGGLLGFSTYLEGTFKELIPFTEASLLYLTPKQWELIAERAGFKSVFIEVKDSTLSFPSVKDMFKHISATGVNSLNIEKKSVGQLKEIMEKYSANNEANTLTYSTLIMILRNE